MTREFTPLDNGKLFYFPTFEIIGKLEFPLSDPAGQPPTVGILWLKQEIDGCGWYYVTPDLVEKIIFEKS